MLALLFFTSFSADSLRAQEIFKDIPFDAEGHTLDIYRANPAGPTMFYVPGGNWYKHDKNLYEKLGVALAPYGINLVVPQYGTEQKYPNNLIDVIEAVQWAQANLPVYGMTATKFHLVGHSAGAHLAYMMLTDKRYCISEANFSSLTLISGLYDINFIVRFGNRWRNWAPLQGWHASPIHAKRLVCLPMTVVLAENDYDVVKRQTSHFLSANAHIGQPVRSLVIPGDDHVSILMNSQTNGLLNTVIERITTTATINIPQTDGNIMNELPTLVEMATPAGPMLQAPAEAPSIVETPVPAAAPVQETKSVEPKVADVPTPPAPATAPFAPEPKLPALETPEAVAPKVASPKVEAPKLPATPPVVPAPAAN